ncbi:unnamed protein product [Didymodactylos carnosus]|uniref:EGF-like domain-containing protein n=1 Tax=Didymodactylos carnosus TaxID=1234261 RepID=A0A8S2R6P7_9BILA|nr:unnamed protein product [Didymodactylos carnosus]CAF4143330.1 unnamed protein product [Didymodactylos carnosus]
MHLSHLHFERKELQEHCTSVNLQFVCLRTFWCWCITILRANSALGPICSCLPTYTGQDCSAVLNPCLSQPCDTLTKEDTVIFPLILALGELTVSIRSLSIEFYTFDRLHQNGTLSYVCTCRPEYTGISPCASQPCAFGTRYEDLAGWSCVCDPGWTEVQCKDGINECESDHARMQLFVLMVLILNQCLNSGTCIDGTDQFYCICPSWYYGLPSENRVYPCNTSNLCVNNGTCLENLTTTRGFTCQYSPGFTGILCEINIDECSSQPCHRGQCIDKINGYVCAYYAGNVDVQCEVSLDTAYKY